LPAPQALSAPNCCACNSAAARGIDSCTLRPRLHWRKWRVLKASRDRPRGRSEGRPGIRAASFDDFIAADDLDNPIWEIPRFVSMGQPRPVCSWSAVCCMMLRCPTKQEKRLC
jgi:hypothetical protein